MEPYIEEKQKQIEKLQKENKILLNFLEDVLEMIAIKREIPHSSLVFALGTYHVKEPEKVIGIALKEGILYKRGEGKYAVTRTK